MLILMIYFLITNTNIISYTQQGDFGSVKGAVNIHNNLSLEVIFEVKQTSNH